MVLHALGIRATGVLGAILCCGSALAASPLECRGPEPKFVVPMVDGVVRVPRVEGGFRAAASRLSIRAALRAYLLVGGGSPYIRQLISKAGAETLVEKVRIAAELDSTDPRKLVAFRIYSPPPTNELLGRYDIADPAQKSCGYVSLEKLKDLKVRVWQDTKPDCVRISLDYVDRQKVARSLRFSVYADRATPLENPGVRVESPGQSAIKTLELEIGLVLSLVPMQIRDVVWDGKTANAPTADELPVAPAR